ncbi:18929_t:CDS:2 [Dentiscutata erythropus]|uniref:18929_t:CDS:1 n=1 Tax=Dentiscutata erythropus TaxID=1348616 RepID=A0A9N8VTL0_9GLOM|nr:18929_t:CDS:2 [Dentiscutata erythropus]
MKAINVILVFMVFFFLLDISKSSPLEGREELHCIGGQDAPCGKRPGGGIYCCTVTEPVAASQMAPFVHHVDY